VTREEVVVERHPVSGDQRASAAIKEGEEIRIPLMEEEVRVEKAPVVREEIEVPRGGTDRKPREHEQGRGR